MTVKSEYRCCGRKPLLYKTAQNSFVTPPYHFCTRCDRSYSMDGAQIESWAWKRNGDEFVPRERPHKCEATIVIVGSVFTIYRCRICGMEEWL